jgi:hypothetical protein
MTPEQRTRALTHYTAEAAVALRIEQLEAQNAMLVEALQALLPMVAEWHAEFPRDIGDKEPAAIAAARAALANVEAARTGANT